MDPLLLWPPQNLLGVATLGVDAKQDTWRNWKSGKTRPRLAFSLDGETQIKVYKSITSRWTGCGSIVVVYATNNHSHSLGYSKVNAPSPFLTTICLTSNVLPHHPRAPRTIRYAKVPG